MVLHKRRFDQLRPTGKSTSAEKVTFGDYAPCMAPSEPFDLPAFMLSNFNRMDFGPDLFEQRPTGIRFEIGWEQVSRAAKLFDFVFAESPDCVLVSQDWVTDGTLDSRFTPLFQTPGVYVPDSLRMQTLDVFPLDETAYRLTWTRLPLVSIDAVAMFQGIANREQEGAPKISSGVFAIAADSKVIVHMYDDRGLDIVAAELNTLRSIYEAFDGWVLDNQRHRIAFRFSTALRNLDN